MSDVNERGERLRDALRAAAEALHGITTEERQAANGNVELLERVVAYAQVVVDQTDPELVTDGSLTEIESVANGIVANPVGSTGNARATADQILPHIASLPPARDRNVEQAVKETAANFQRSATHRLNTFESDLEARRAAIETELESLRAATDQTASDTGTRMESLVSGFESKLTEFETTLDAQRLATSQAQERHSTAFSESQEERSASFQSELAKANDELASMIDAASAEVERNVAEIRRMERESAGLVGAIGLAGTAERYGEERTEQRKIADRMRGLTIFFAVGAVLTAVYSVVRDVDDNSVVLAKLGVALVFGALATYTARQSGRHRVREERARNLQLELTAFAPFIEPLDKDQQDFERVVMARRTFGQIRALPEADAEHTYGPLGPITDKLRRPKAEEE